MVKSKRIYDGFDTSSDDIPSRILCCAMTTFSWRFASSFSERRNDNCFGALFDNRLTFFHTRRMSWYHWSISNFHENVIEISLFFALIWITGWSFSLMVSTATNSSMGISILSPEKSDWKTSPSDGVLWP